MPTALTSGAVCHEMPPFERCSEAVAVGAKEGAGAGAGPVGAGEGTKGIGVWKVWQKSMLRVGLLVSERLPREGGGGGGAGWERVGQFVTSHRKSLKRLGGRGGGMRKIEMRGRGEEGRGRSERQEG